MHSLVKHQATKYQEDQQWRIWHLIFILGASYQMVWDKDRPQFRRSLVSNIPSVIPSFLDDIQFGNETEIAIWWTIGAVY
jgi:hypothetical protein